MLFFIWVLQPKDYSGNMEQSQSVRPVQEEQKQQINYTPLSYGSLQIFGPSGTKCK